MDYGMYYESLIRELTVYAVNPEVLSADAGLIYEAINAIKSLKDDADRYVCIRDQMSYDDVNLIRHLSGKDLDSFIDEKMKGQND